MLQNIFAALGAVVGSLVAFARALIYRLGWRKLSIIAAIVVVILLAVHFIGGTAQTPATANAVRSVTVDSVAHLSTQGSGLSVGGVVSSKAEATVRAEKAGEVRAVNYELGDTVGAGAVVAEVENASERAAVAQAQAGVDTALAAAQISGTGFTSAQSGVVTALLTAYAAADNAIHGEADQMILELNIFPTQYSLRFRTSSNGSKGTVEDMRAALDTTLARERAAAQTLSASADLTQEISTTSGELRQVLVFLDTLLQTLNNAIPDGVVSSSDIVSYKTAIAGARTSVTAAYAGLTTAQQNLANAQTGSVGGSSTSAAAVKQAEANLAAARANLEHTIIRAPISGTINSLSLKLGDYIQNGAAVLTVANNNALEIVAYVTETDAHELSVGSSATISGGTTGTITRIAPAIDPATKKIEVRIGLPATTTTMFTNGQSVTVELAHTVESSEVLSRLIIPLSALKIGADGMSVFTVDADNTLVAHPVTIGELLGDRVVVVEGLTPDMQIVTDARGLRAGETINLLP